MENPVVITDDMLIQAAKVDDVDEALRGVMDQVGITDGGVAGMVFSKYEEDWPAADPHYRLAMLREWRDVEKSYANLFGETNG